MAAGPQFTRTAAPRPGCRRKTALHKANSLPSASSLVAAHAIGAIGKHALPAACVRRQNHGGCASQPWHNRHGFMPRSVFEAVPFQFAMQRRVVDLQRARRGGLVAMCILQCAAQEFGFERGARLLELLCEW